MARRSVWVVAGQQWTLLVRDRRLATIATALVLVLVTSAFVGAAWHASREADRREAEIDEARVWEMQGPANPHGATHFGRYVFKSISPLAVFDTGLLPQLGASLKLESHVNNPATHRPIDAGTVLDRFGRFSPAALLQVLAPLLTMLAGFSAFSGDDARDLLRQELAAGIAPVTLMAGRLLGLGALAGGVLVAAAVAGGGGLVVAGAGTDAAAALGWMVLGYGLYLFAWSALTLAASAAFASARTALVVLVAFWVLAAFVVPRIAPSVAEAVVPTLSRPALVAAVTREIQEGPDGHDPRDARLERLRQDTMRQYGVTSLDQLPVDFNGIAFEHGEALATAIYRRHFAELYDAYDRQATIQRVLAMVSPVLAIRPWSAALAQSDQHAHRRFLEQAEHYRYELVQTLNRAIIHRPLDGGPGPYLADVASMTRSLGFAPEPPSLHETLNRHWSDLGALGAWAVGAALLALLCAHRLGRVVA